MLGPIKRMLGAPLPLTSPCPAFHLAALRVPGHDDQKIEVSGCGLTSAVADVRCLGEAAEFLSLAWRDEIRPAAIRQSASVGLGEALCIGATEEPVVARPLQMAPLLPLNGGPAVGVPATLVYHGHPDGTREPRFAADSNGAAAGQTRARAIRSALLELIERDAVAIWWYNRLRRPPVDRAARHHRAIQRLAVDLARRERLLFFTDLTHDLGVPVVAAISAKNDGSNIVIGTAAAATLRDAVIGAAGELVQILSGIEGAVCEGELGEREKRALSWLRGAALRDCDYLIPSKSATPAPQATVKNILSRLKRVGIHVYAHDASRADLGIPVVKLVAPGLRHTKPRFGPGRLFDVPVELGWLAEPTPIADFNPWPWPF